LHGSRAGCRTIRTFSWRGWAPDGKNDNRVVATPFALVLMVASNGDN
jgi:hypothetical protein